MGWVFLFLQRKQMQVSEERNALSDVLTFDYSNKKHISIRGTAKKPPNLQLGRVQCLFPQEVQHAFDDLKYSRKLYADSTEQVCVRFKYLGL